MKILQGLSVFKVGGKPLGQLTPVVQAALLQRLGRFGLSVQDADTSGSTVTLGDANSSPAELERYCQSLAEELHAVGLVTGWRNERFTLKKPDGTPWFNLERASFRTFGFESEAVHVHGYTASGDVWLGRRSLQKAIDPDKLDNLAAGGLSSGETPLNCTKRELWEEAGVPEALSGTLTALPKPLVSQRMEGQGVHREVLHCFTLLLPENFIPENQDGEVAGFMRCNAHELQQLLDKKALTTDAALCTEYALQCAAVLARK